MERWRREREPWKGSDRKGRLPVDWDRLRLVVLDRCGYRCQWRDNDGRCRATATDVDHIVPGDDHSLVNLQGLCSAHHLAKTSKEAHEARAKRKALGRLPEEKQPGIIDGPPQPTQYRGF